jgi:hypothetical protein
MTPPNDEPRNRTPSEGNVLAGRDGICDPWASLVKLIRVDRIIGLAV